MENTALQGMSVPGLTSDALAAIYGGIVGGVLGILGASMAQFIGRLIRGYGKVRCVVPYIETNPHQFGFITFRFQLSFHNDKEMPIGIYDPMIILYKAGTELTCAFLIEEEDGKPARSGSKAPLRFLDLPPRKWVHKQIYFETAMQQKEGLDWSNLEDQVIKLRWSYPSGRLKKQTIPTYSTNQWRDTVSGWRNRARRALQRNPR